MKKQKLVVLTGAGISAESGLQTFRDGDGLWEGHNIHDVATPEAWHRNPSLVQDFYNMRRKAVLEAQPNNAHLLLAKLEQYFDVQIITQNIDNLHERAGSTNVLHLHGIITKSQSTRNPELIYDMEGWELKIGDTCELGAQLRPFIVWFGEAVPEIENAASIVSQADLFMIIGTSLVVYPAAGLVHYTSPEIPIYILDKGAPDFRPSPRITFIQQLATVGLQQWMDLQHLQ
ncbi:MAG: NAD-dependent deacylase [Bacteroidota bacterium]